MSTQRIRETVIATLQRIRDGLIQAVDGIEQLIKLHEEGLAKPAQAEPSITQDEVDALPWTPHKDGDAEWSFVDPRDDDPEDVKVLRVKLADYLRAKGRGPRKAVFIGKYRISFSGDRDQFFRRSLVGRASHPR